ncbi:MAG TPA: M23 family metallopeptidase [Flavobacterium sp.]|jgi:murein DD-endopeptidase MepM/ murein hydrolase activator NlpD
MKKTIYIWLTIIAITTIIVSCAKINKITDSLTKPSARDVYEREFKNGDVAYQQWKAEYTAALSDSIELTLPYLEKGTFNAPNISAYSYTIHLLEGQVLTAEVVRDSVNQRVFADFYEAAPTGFRHIASQKPEDNSFEYPITATGTYKLILQPEINAATNFYISIGIKPAFGFPVAGKGNSAMQSFWGYDRDGGARKHEGIDIFASRGTPVVAVTDGNIGFTGERGLGGKQVWLRAGMFGPSIYYAHLDSIAVVDGMKVSAGDTLGFVGSTGNAKGGAPHLHFGIYRNGAVDPHAYIYKILKPEIPSLKKFSRSFKADAVKVKGATANLRKSPSTNAAAIDTARANDKLQLLGEHGEWLHIKTMTGKKAFLHKSLASEVK